MVKLNEEGKLRFSSNSMKTSKQCLLYILNWMITGSNSFDLLTRELNVVSSWMALTLRDMTFMRVGNAILQYFSFS
jgi:hypothetical protein